MKKKRKYTRKKKIVPLCGYCDKFKCKKTIEFNDVACKEFELTKIFLCKRDNNRLHIEVCLARQEKGTCSRCKQGKLIKEISDG